MNAQDLEQRAIAALIAERDALAQEVERLQAYGVHTCGPHCRRIACVLRRERDALREALEKLVEAADTSDEFRYGTLATGFVRDMASAALALAQGVQS